MKLDDLESAFQRLEADLVAAGVFSKAAARICDDAKSDALADILETYNDRRLLDLFRESGAEVIAQRQGISVRSAHRRRQEAIDRLSLKQSAPKMAEPVAEKAA